jgi:hypothetical protein
MPTWQQDRRVLSRRSGDRVVVLAPGQDAPLVLEGTGAVVWGLLADPIDEEELVALVADGFGIPTATVEADLRPFLGDLHLGGAVRAV